MWKRTRWPSAAQPILSLVSRAFLNDRRSIIERLARKGEGAIGHYRYMVQQVEQFQTEEETAMAQAVTKTLEELDREIYERMILEAPVEMKLQGLSPERILAGLSKEGRARLRELFGARRGTGPVSPDRLTAFRLAIAQNSLTATATQPLQENPRSAGLWETC